MKKLKLSILTFLISSCTLFSQGFEVLPQVAQMNVTRFGHMALTLPNGNVLVIGGHTQGFSITSTAEIYNPQTDTWSLVDVPNPHDGGSFVRLNSGKYMFFGGFSSGSGVGQSAVTTIYDPVSNEFSNGPQMNTARAFATASVLADGKVLIVGNWYNTGNAEIYDPVSTEFTPLGVAVQERSYPLVFPCTDGSAVVIGGYGNYGTPNFSDVTLFNQTTLEFTAVSAEIISGETGWIASWSSNFQQISDMKLANGNYVFMIYKPVSSSEYYYGFAEFNPATKEIKRIATTPEFPIYTASEPTAWAFGINTAKDPATDYMYISGIKFTSGPFPSRLYAFNPSSGELSIPAGETEFDYQIYSSSKAWVNGNLLCTGGTIDGSNFNITNAVKLLRPQNSLGMIEPRKNDLKGTIYPNPANSGFAIQSNKTYKSARFMDLSGRIILESAIIHQTNFVNTSLVANGLYMVILVSYDGTSDMLKIVVQHE
jgi:hypothetical protein